MNVLELPQHWRARALIVRDVEEPEGWFTPLERSVVESFRLPKRRFEWMTSRIAEKELRRRGATGSHVSYSHSGPYGAAAIDQRPTGIDVEVQRSVAAAAAHLFLTEDEEETAAGCRIADALLHFWSAKEARWKQLGGSVATLKRLPLRLVEVADRGLRFEGVETVAVSGVVAALAADGL